MHHTRRNVDRIVRAITARDTAHGDPPLTTGEPQQERLRIGPHRLDPPATAAGKPRESAPVATASLRPREGQLPDAAHGAPRLSQAHLSRSQPSGAVQRGACHSRTETAVGLRKVLPCVHCLSVGGIEAGQINLIGIHTSILGRKLRRPARCVLCNFPGEGQGKTSAKSSCRQRLAECSDDRQIGPYGLPRPHPPPQPCPLALGILAAGGFRGTYSVGDRGLPPEDGPRTPPRRWRVAQVPSVARSARPPRPRPARLARSSAQTAGRCARQASHDHTSAIEASPIRGKIAGPVSVLPVGKTASGRAKHLPRALDAGRVAQVDKGAGCGFKPRGHRCRDLLGDKPSPRSRGSRPGSPVSPPGLRSGRSGKARSRPR